MKNFLGAVFLVVVFSFRAWSQCSLYPVSLQERVQQSDFIFEGKVVASQGFWNAGHTKIYTAHQVQVLKIFKGSAINQAVIITIGGQVGTDMLKVSPGLELEVGDMGVFMSKTSTVSLPATIEALPGLKLKTYADEQGFIHYNSEQKASDIFNLYPSFAGPGGVYESIQDLTGVPYTDVAPQNSGSTSGKKYVPLATPTITSISPLMLPAGVDTIITIKGTNFESSRGTGMVQFRFADDGGGTFFTHDPYHYVSWTDTMILVKVPSRAGTGQVKITNNSAGTATSTDTVKIPFNQLNVNYSGAFYKPAHRSFNGAGGYTWRMNPLFKRDPNRVKSFYRALDTWRCGTFMNWVVGDTSYIDDIASDGVCIVRIDDLDPGKLGVCYSWWGGCSSGGGPFEWYVSELDIEFDSLVNWQYGPAAPGGSQYDFESVAAHELGHGHQLGHVINSSEIMHFSISNGQSKRSLSSNDINGGNYVKNQSTRPAFCGFNPIQPVNSGNCITSTPSSRFGINDNDICLSQSITVTDSSFGSITSYIWDFGAGASPAGASTKGPHTVSYSTPGTKSIKLITVGVAGNDTLLKTSVVNVWGTPGQPSQIEGDTITCVKTVAYKILSQPMAKLYRWTATGGTVANNGDTIITVTWNGYGTKTLKVRSVNDCDSSQDKTVSVWVKSNLNDITVQNGLTQLGDSACLKPAHSYDSKVNGFSQKWSVTDGNFIAGDDTGRHVIVKWNSLGKHYVHLVIYAECDSLVQDDSVEVIDKPEVSFGFSAVARTVTFTTTGEAKIYNWSFGDGNTSNQKNPVHTYSTEGTFTARLIASNNCGSDTAEQQFTVMSVKGINKAGVTVHVIPNPFRDEALIRLENMQAAPSSVEIYNLLGEKIQNHTWDGSSNELLIHRGNMPAGVYLYKVVFPSGVSAWGKMQME